MIDIHSHVLPLVDDGSKSMEASMTMIKEAVSIGVTDLFCTPHFMKVRNYLSTAQANQKAYDQLTEAIRKAGYSIRLHLANEIYYTIDTMRQLKAGSILPMGKSNKVLVEFSMSEPEEDIVEAIHNLKAAGYVPIIAHPERYPYIEKISDYEIMKKMGALIQINAASVIGKYGVPTQKLCLKLIKIGLVDFIASDVHEFRVNYLKFAYDFIKSQFNETVANHLFSNPIILE